MDIILDKKESALQESYSAVNELNNDRQKKITKAEIEELIKSRFEDGREIHYIDFMPYPVTGNKEGLRSFLHSLIDDDED